MKVYRKTFRIALKAGFLTMTSFDNNVPVVAIKLLASKRRYLGISNAHIHNILSIFCDLLARNIDRTHVLSRTTSVSIGSKPTLYNLHRYKGRCPPSRSSSHGYMSVVRLYIFLGAR